MEIVLENFFKDLIFDGKFNDIIFAFGILKYRQCDIIDICSVFDMEQTKKCSFYISKYPVSNSFILQYIDKQFLTYYDYECFISKLNEETGMHFFIPTVEQWEFGVLSSNIWSVKNSNTLDEKTVHAESNNSYVDKTQSQRGFYDMSGNLGELCRSSDEKSDVCYIKGGSYKSARIRCRIDYTDVKFKHIPLKNVGLRLCL